MWRGLQVFSCWSLEWRRRKVLIIYLVYCNMVCIKISIMYYNFRLYTVRISPMVFLYCVRYSPISSHQVSINHHIWIMLNFTSIVLYTERISPMVFLYYYLELCWILPQLYKYHDARIAVPSTAKDLTLYFAITLQLALFWLQYSSHSMWESRWITQISLMRSNYSH
jgi:hypothetical protein